MDDNELKARIAAGPAPKVTPERIEEVIGDVQFLHHFAGTLTICAITLVNGFTVTGESACADPANYNEEIGDAIALKDAKSKIWALEGYLLRQRLHDEGK